MNLMSLEDVLHPDTVADGANTVNQAPEPQVDAHRNLLSEAFQMLGQQGGAPAHIAQQAQVSTTDPHAMNAEELVRTTLALARSHPQIVEEVASRYPQAQPIVGAILGSAANAGNAQNSGLFEGLLAKLTGA
ncbi:MAG TPA: hypothetical protein VFW40_05790 [Capsulimonadaceae bacterium]|nr:hypothetical protein [Capsulimonadaceae bacterium]